jgi:hypothetical protein
MSSCSAPTQSEHMAPDNSKLRSDNFDRNCRSPMRKESHDQLVIDRMIWQPTTSL